MLTSPAPEPDVEVAIGLGSNQGDPVGAVREAARALAASPGLRRVERSSLFRTSPVGLAEQPDFVNAVVVARTSLAPRALLDLLLAIEASAGRIRGPRFGPRTLDLDLLLYGDAVVDEPGLAVPHPRMGDRGFVLAPLAELRPGWMHPTLGASADALRRRWELSTADPERAVRPLLAGGAP